MAASHTRLFICLFLVVPIYCHSDNTKVSDKGNVLGHLLSLEGRVSRLATKLEIKEKENTALNKKLLSTKSELENAKVSISKLSSKVEAVEEEHLALSNKLVLMNQTTSERFDQMNGGRTGSVCFEVSQRAHPITLGNKEVLKFDEVTLSRKGAYNPKSGIFTAPMNGTYIFWANIMSADKGFFYITLYKDGTELSRGYTSAVEVYHGTASLMYITKVSKGQHVWFTNGQDQAVTKIFGRNYSSYGATLLTAV